ncbi:YegP family protein [Vibrio parahaemolyticus]|nr:YegP family protein [Vibrio parahaemolyticus]
MSGKFELYKDTAGEYRFRLKAGNGQNILASEGYTTKSSCENGIDSVKKMRLTIQNMKGNKL